MSLERETQAAGPHPARDLSTVFEEHYRVIETSGGDLKVMPREEELTRTEGRRNVYGDRLFVAEQRADGTYGIGLTEAGVRTFETALGIACDLGGDSVISPYSTIADIMERTATREELSDLLRSRLTGFIRFLRLMVLRRKLRGSERPSAHQIVIGHLGKTVIVLLFVLWTLQQFIAAVEDITAIPNILGSSSLDLLHPMAPFSQVGSNISDAGHRFLLGIVGLHLVYIAGALIRPFARIYRKDAIIPCERAVLRLINRLLARLAPVGPARKKARASGRRRPTAAESRGS